MGFDDLTELLTRVRHARRDSKLLMYAVIVANVVYVFVAVTRGPNAIAWTGVLLASVAAHAIATSIRLHGIVLEKQIARHLCRPTAAPIEDE